jgi:ribosomal protein S18 acetylase RimI-like enzyme
MPFILALLVAARCETRAGEDDTIGEMTVVLPTRQAVAADAAAVTSLVNSAYRGDSSRAGWTTEADLLGGQRVDLESIEETLRRPDSVILLLEEGDLLMGCVHLERTEEAAYLGMLTIRPTAQGAGLGRHILESGERWAAAHWSSREIHMTVIVQRSELIAWYERRGYTRTGQRKPFPYGEERFGLPRREDLEFEVLRKSLPECVGLAPPR